jgi:hemerythrin
MFEWRDEFSVQIGSVDAQHRVLFGLADELYTAMSVGKSQLALSHILNRLVQYTRTHFAHEERLMRLHGYPELAAHKAEHDALTSKVLAFEADFSQGRIAMSVELLQFLKVWLEHHIQGSDQKYSLSLRSKAVA